MKKTVSTFITRIRKRFTEQSAGCGGEFIQGGRAVLVIAEQEFNATTLANAQRELQSTQLELEQVSEDLLRAKKQNRLQQLEITRLTKAYQPSQARKLDRLKKSLVERLQTIAAILVGGQRRENLAPPTDEEKIQYLLMRVGMWLTELEADLAPEDAAQARRFAKLDLPGAYTKRRPAVNSVVQRIALPSTETHREELTKLQLILARRSRWELLDDKLLLRLEVLLDWPESELRSVGNVHPAGKALVKQWQAVRGLLQTIREEKAAPDTTTALLE